MSKAILVMEMPDNCISCPISTCYSCHVHGKQPHPRIGKPEWCPLRELPEKRSPAREGMDYYNHGWNAYIDAIERSKANE